MKCEKCCKNPARYNLYEIHSDGSKTWLNVCEDCEKRIGDRNMLLLTADNPSIDIAK